MSETKSKSTPEETQEAQDTVSQTVSVDSPTASNATSTETGVAAPQALATSDDTSPTAANKSKGKKKTNGSPKTSVAEARRPKRAKSVLFLLAESALAANVPLGQAENTTLPRSAATNTPCIPSSEFRGSLERFFAQPPGPQSNPAPTAKSFADAEILAYPVRTMRGVFTWVTSIRQLTTFAKTLKDTTCAPRWPLVGLDENAILSGPHNSCMVKQHVALEEYNFAVTLEPRVQGISRWLAANALPQSSEYHWWRSKLARDLVLVPHEVFVSLVAQNLPYNTLSEEFSVQYNELLSRDTILYSLLDDAFNNTKLEISLCAVGKMQHSGLGIAHVHLLTRANNKVKRSKKKKPSAKPAVDSGADSNSESGTSQSAKKSEAHLGASSDTASVAATNPTPASLEASAHE